MPFFDQAYDAEFENEVKTGNGSTAVPGATSAKNQFSGFSVFWP